MGDGEVKRKDGHRITKNQEIVFIEDSFLVFGKMIETEETLVLVYLFQAHFSRTAPEPSLIELEADRESPAEDIPHPDMLQRFITFPKIGPGLFLF
jgi:hypothetical protein